MLVNFKKFEYRLPDSPKRLPDSPSRRVADSSSWGVVFRLWISPRNWSQNRNGSKGSVRDLWGTNFCKNPRKSFSLPCTFKCSLEFAPPCSSQHSHNVADRGFAYISYGGAITTTAQKAWSSFIIFISMIRSIQPLWASHPEHSSSRDTDTQTCTPNNPDSTTKIHQKQRKAHPDLLRLHNNASSQIFLSHWSHCTACILSL